LTVKACGGSGRCLFLATSSGILVILLFRSDSSSIDTACG
jgi:hypothetical protein